ncbi:hypothetical protein LLG95_14345 [bacterium]|nr:hypothetical protein [bacterium]
MSTAETTSDVLAGAERVDILGVNYLHLKTRDDGDLYVTRHGETLLDNIRPESWFERGWFRQHRERLKGTSTIYRIQTKRVRGRSADIVVKWSRMGQDVPLETKVLEDFLSAEFNTPFEEFALVEQLRKGDFGPRDTLILTHRPLGIYVPPQRWQLWQTGRSRDKVNRKVRSHPGVEIDILRQYIVIYEWIKGTDAAETFEEMGLPDDELEQLTYRVDAEIHAKGFQVADMKPAHIIVRKNLDGQLVRHHGKISYALVDFELLQRTPEHEERIREAKRSEYLRRQKDRLRESVEPLPSNLTSVNILGVDYIFGRVESTNGRLWIVGRDAKLFDYFQPERWRATNQVRMSDSHHVYYTLTKDNIHLVWKTSRVGEIPKPIKLDYQGRRMIKAGYNSPFEEFALALELGRQGFPVTYPRAIYMTGTRTSGPDLPQDMRAFMRLAHLKTPEGEPILRPERDYIKIWGYWNGTDEMLASGSGEVYQGINALQAYERGLLTEDDLRRLTLRAIERLTELGYDYVNLSKHHFLLTLDSNKNLVLDAQGEPEFRLCNFEMLRRISDREEG